MLTASVPLSKKALWTSLSVLISPTFSVYKKLKPSPAKPKSITPNISNFGTVPNDQVILALLSLPSSNLLPSLMVLAENSKTPMTGIAIVTVAPLTRVASKPSNLSHFSSLMSTPQTARMTSHDSNSAKIFGTQLSYDI